MDEIQYLPPPSVFFEQTMDVYTNTGTFPPAGGNLRQASVPVRMTGTFMEGHRSKVSSTDSYTHVLLCDPNIEIRDPYTGTGNAPSGSADYITVPTGSSGASANWWKVVYSFNTEIPGIGRRKVILVDRWGLPGTWANIP
jgi:hypothetical protein